MAVPKKKRSREVIRVRRSNSRVKLLNKYNISIKNYSNFVSINLLNKSNEKVCSFNVKSCAYNFSVNSNNNISNKVCLGCYVTHFVPAYIKYI